MNQILGKFAIGAVASCAVAWGFFEPRKVFSEAKHSNIHIEYQEPQPNKGLWNSEHSKGALGNIHELGIPTRSPDITYYKNHALCYNQEKKIPHWVLEILTKETLKGCANREKSNFKSDLSFPNLFLSKNEDYSRSGWSRGHMAAAGNHKHDQEAMNNTFFLTNIVPQDISNNAGFWNRIEFYCRDLIQKFDKVWVVSGPLFLSENEGGKKYVKYEVIGNSEVAVPTHLFKIIVAETDNKKLMNAFVVPNKPIPNNRTLKEHQVPVEYVETKSGFQFFPKLNRKSTEDLCGVEGCNLKSWDEFEMMFIRKKLESATTLNRLEKVWKEIPSKGLKPDNQLIEEYKRKKAEFERSGHEAGNEAARSRG